MSQNAEALWYAAPALLTAGAAAALTSARQDALVVLAGALVVGGLASGLAFYKRPKAPLVASSKNEAGNALIAMTIADSNPDAVLFFADSGQIRFANATARELFFLGREPHGENFLRLVATAPLPLREALLGESDRLFNIEIEGQRETFHVSRRSFVVSEELHTLLIVKHLTREISRREVEVLKRVIRVISHEVNNSLAPVSSLVHSARKIAQVPDPSAKLARVFDTIEERTRHLASFLEGYANMARLPEPRVRRVDWEPFLRQLGELHPGVKLPPIPAEPGVFDPVQVEQVLINLFKNAAEAGSPTDGIELFVRVGANGETELRVRDHGPGFSEEALKSALLPLYTTKERGSGMGLALCREIIEAHGGTIGLSNAPDGGGMVHARLPGRRREDSAPQLSRSRLTLTKG
jgi:nitrogen fixation/metabolism regulation signal transduction histidine kinase